MSNLEGDFQQLWGSMFKDIPIAIYEVTNYSDPIYAFLIKFESADSLIEKWRLVSNFIAVNFQAKLDSAFSRWNIYIFYITPGRLNGDEKQIKYEIENDTYSGRKIVIEKTQSDERIIDEHIINQLNLYTNTSEEISKSFRVNDSLYKVIEKYNVYQRKDLAARNAFNELKQTWKDEPKN